MICERCSADVEVVNEGLCNECVQFYEWFFEEDLSVDQAEMKDQISIMTDPSQWQGRRTLPLIRVRELRGGEEVEVGFLYLDVTRTVWLMPTVYLGTALQVVEHEGNKVFVEELSHSQIMNLTSLNYQTMASVVYAGWVVDE